MILCTGLELVVAVLKDAKYPHAKFMCEMCKCYFNCEFAKVLHCKGRRHRLNYKVYVSINTSIHVYTEKLPARLEGRASK